MPLATTMRGMQGRGGLFDSILDTVGDTPVIWVNNLAVEGRTIYVKAEFFNPASSVKDRLALNVIEAAERAGERHLSTPLFDSIEADMNGEELALSRSTPHCRFTAA